MISRNSLACGAAFILAWQAAPTLAQEASDTAGGRDGVSRPLGTQEAVGRSHRPMAARRIGTQEAGGRSRRINIDADFVDAPDDVRADGGLGFEIRRARLGASGDIPGGLGYKAELEFAGDDVVLTDAILTYDIGALTLTAGQHNNFQSLTELTSSLHSSFIERAAFTDAFGFERCVSGCRGEYSCG